MKNKKQMKKNKQKKNNIPANKNVAEKESRAAAEVQKKVNKPATAEAQKKVSKPATTEAQKKMNKPAAAEVQKKVSKPTAAEAQKKRNKPATAEAQKKVSKPATTEAQKKVNKPAAAEVQKKVSKPTAAEVQKKVSKPTAAEAQKKRNKLVTAEVQKKVNKPAAAETRKKVNKPEAGDSRKERNKPATANEQKKTDSFVAVEVTEKNERRIKPRQSVKDKDNVTREQKSGRGQKAGTWKEVIYNCPYLIAVLATSLVVMICSEKIGIRAVAAETKTAVQQTMSRGTFAKRSPSDSGADKDDSDSKNRKKTENLQEDAANADKNAGECKENNDDKKLKNNSLSNNIDVVNPENVKENKTGITRFEYYEPQQIESRYYSDAGKVAMTTEYHYTKENISYFSDAAFLGDSRTLGISDYAGLDEADFYCDSGMMIFKLLEEEGVTYQKTGDKVDLTQVLQEKQYGKIYIMLGMNELGYGNTDTYLEQYREVVGQIREWQPDAIIYIMANLHVSREKNNPESEFNNININDKNAAAALLANGTDVFYLDANPLFTDEEGFLNAELTFDGVHLYAQHYDLWREFLLEHAVEPKGGQTDEENQLSEKTYQPEAERQENNDITEL